MGTGAQRSAPSQLSVTEGLTLALGPRGTAAKLSDCLGTPPNQPFPHSLLSSLLGWGRVLGLGAHSVCREPTVSPKMVASTTSLPRCHLCRLTPNVPQ